MKKLTITIALVASTALSACATTPQNVAASYVSPSQFSNLNCNQLNSEARRINAALVAATGRQQQAASNDAAMTAVSLLIFWPAAFFIKGDDNAGELSRLKGEAEAINAAAQSRGCIA